MRGKKPEYQIRIAIERIKRLFSLADESLKQNPERSARYVQMARKIAMRYNIAMPKELRRSFCRQCNFYLKPGVSCTVRANKKNIVIKCLGCGNIRRYPYKKGQSLSAST